MPRRLLVLAGPDEGKSFTLPESDAFLLGRSRATETQLIDPHVSRVHCQVQVESDHLMITDFESAGGTFVNSQKITGKQALKPRDFILIGSTRMQYLEDGETADTAPPLARPVQKKSPATWQDALVGKRFGHYKVGPVLARGRNGYVFHARDIQKNIPVALKILEGTFSSNAQSVQRFVRAMKTVLPLKHPNLVQVLAAGKSSGHCWVAMEYIAGESLSAVISRIEHTGQLDWRRILALGICMARAIAYAHKKKIIHRNITPSNILVGKGPQDTKLADLMLAKALEGEEGQPISRPGQLLGEIAYMAPERTAGGVKVDGRADIYSLGATLFALFAGRPPFTGETITELVTRIRREPPPHLRDFYLGVPGPFEEKIRTMLAKTPDDRPTTAAELLADLEAYAADSGVKV
ncbi:MAG: FHA domain-containing protein [Planctomycetes bacterium]|nr:FHA domain-containing protein [Planctomycetota bacterium]